MKRTYRISGAASVGIQSLGIFALAVLLSFCGPKQQKVERTVEDGVGVVLNHQEPYRIKGEPSSLQLEELFTIDTEPAEMAELGLVDIYGFDLDSEGNIYLYQNTLHKAHLVYRFDEAGAFSTSFGVSGQGPGEIETPHHALITYGDEIQIQCYSKRKLFYFNKRGTLEKDIIIPQQIGSWVYVFPLRNENCLVYSDNFDWDTSRRFDKLDLYDSSFQKLMEIDRCDYGTHFIADQKKKVVTPRVFIHRVWKDRIYFGHEGRGYEILIFDLNGRLIRIIRKQYEPAPPPDEFAENLLVNMGRFKDRAIVPDKMPPFHYFFLDDDGRLYVRTYEKGGSEGEYFHDIFNAEGVFIARKSMMGYHTWMGPGKGLDTAKAGNGRFYCIREKESGYQELVVFKMIWR